MFDLIVERKVSKKGNDYFCLVADLGYRKQVLTYDTAIIIALCNITEQVLYDIVKIDQPYKVGSIKLDM